MKWCVDTTRTKKYAIRDGNLAIEKFGAAAEKADADIARLTDEIAELNANIATWSADKAAATKVRDTEHADYVAVHTDLSDSIDAMSRALSVLASRASGAIGNSFLQKFKATLPQKARQAVDAYLQSGGITGEEAGDAYQFHTSGIQDMVNNLKDKMSDERATVEKEEAEKKHAFQLLEQQLTMDTEEADEKYLAETTAMCEQKASEFESRQALRDEEQVALGKAIEIMSGGSVSGAADKHLPALVQKSFALRASKGVAPIQKQVAVFLQGRATKSESRLLQ